MVLRFGGASSEKPGISEGFQGLDFTGDVPRDGTGFFDVAGTGFDTDDDLLGGADVVGVLDGADARRVGVADRGVDLEVGVDDLGTGLGAMTVCLELGVADLGTGFGAVTVGLAVGVEERAVDRLGVEDLAVGAEDLAVGAVALEEGKVGREVGVEGLEGLAVVVKVERPVGVAALAEDDDGLLLLILEVLSPFDKVGFLGDLTLLEVGSSMRFSSCKQLHRNHKSLAGQ